MRKKTKTQRQGKSIHLGIYFLLIVIFIITVSFAFKVFDSIRSSKFERGSHFTVAVINDKSTEIITISPKDESIKKLTIDGLTSEGKLDNLSIPYDSVAKSKKEVNDDPRNYFTKFIFGDGITSDLSFYDLIKLSIHTRAMGGDNIKEETISIDESGIASYVSTWFIDPEIEKEGIQIEITNATEVSGLGRAYADYVVNSGGNVVLVSSSQEVLGDSVIYYTEDSYTVDKISKLLDIPKQKKELNAVTDIIIQIGKDRVEE